MVSPELLGNRRGTLPACPHDGNFAASRFSTRRRPEVAKRERAAKVAAC